MTLEQESYVLVAQYCVSLIPRPVWGPGNETKYCVCVCPCELIFGTNIRTLNTE